MEKYLEHNLNTYTPVQAASPDAIPLVSDF